MLNTFNQEHSDIKITDDVIVNDIPPRINNKLEKGEISFEEFLSEVYTYLKKGKATKNEPVMGQPDLSKSGGGLTPDKANDKKNSSSSYETEIY